jgi:hypothetical protein
MVAAVATGVDAATSCRRRGNVTHQTNRLSTMGHGQTASQHPRVPLP